MNACTNSPNKKNQLRAEASFRLKIGVATGSEWSLSADTLALLFKLASAPETVMDGLKLLHELQTHQVELEMQHNELERCLQAHEKHQRELERLFKHAPFGYLVVQNDGTVVQSNEAAARLLGLKGKECDGRQFYSYCTTVSAYTLQDVLKVVMPEGPPLMCVLELKPAKYRPRRLQVLVSKVPGEEQYLFGLSSYDQLLKI